jgi:hypothetical protein
VIIWQRVRRIVRYSRRTRHLPWNNLCDLHRIMRSSQSYACETAVRTMVFLDPSGTSELRGRAEGGLHQDTVFIEW